MLNVVRAYELYKTPILFLLVELYKMTGFCSVRERKNGLYFLKKIDFKLRLKPFFLFSLMSVEWGQFWRRFV